MYIVTFIMQCVKIIVKNSSNYLRLLPLNILNSFTVIRIQFQYKILKLLLHLKFHYFCIKLNVFVYYITFRYIILKIQ